METSCESESKVENVDHRSQSCQSWYCDIFNNCYSTYTNIKSLSGFCCGGIHAHDDKCQPAMDCAAVTKLCEENKNCSYKDIKRLKKFRFPFYSIVLSGGSANSIAFLGAYKALYEVGIIKNLKNLAGCSAGSLTAIFYVFKLCPAKLIDIFTTMDFNQFLDSSSCCVFDVLRVLLSYGWYKGDIIEQFVNDFLFKQTGLHCVTLLQLYEITKVHLKITVYNDTYSRVEYWDYLTQPEITVSLAVRCSCAIPGFYAAKTVDNSVYIDGAVEQYFPLDVFNKTPLDKHTLGLVLKDKETQPKKILDSNVIDHFVDLYTSMETLAFDLAHIKDNWKERSISVPNPGKRAYDFNFTEQSKEEIMSLAYEGVLQNLLYYTKYKHFPVGNLKS